MMFANPFKLKKEGILGMNKRNIHYIGFYNDRKNFPFVDDKLKTKKIAEKAGIDVPILITKIEFQSELRHLQKRLLNLEKFVIKPSMGSGGKGILVITDREGDSFIKANGERLGFVEMKDHISNTLSGLYSLGGKPDVAMIETLVEFDPIFSKYSYEGVPDIRVILFKGFPVLAMLRCPTKDSDGKANLHQGAIGVGIDIPTGKALKAVQNNRTITKHPDTGNDFDDLVIPQWNTVLQLSASCYDMIKLGYLGADIVFDKKLGPLVLELNARPGLAIQIANGFGALKRFDVIEKIDETSLSFEERVSFAQKEFSV